MASRIVPPVEPRTKEEVSDALAMDWVKLAPIGQRLAFAGKVGAKDPKTITKAISGEGLPEAHTILNSLLSDPAALFHTFRLYGGCFVPVDAEAANDNATISGLLKASSEYFERMSDGCRCHKDTLALADLFRPLVPAILAVIMEADALRSAS